MIVRCIENKTTSLPESISKHYPATPLESLTKGKEDIVYALSDFYDSTCYCISDDSFSQPMWYPYSLFEISNPRMSRFWICSFRGEPKINNIFLSFPEWAYDDEFYYNLADGEEREVSIFNTYQKLMDLEFPNSTITDSAQIGDDQWLMCPACIDAWESSDKINAMVICPKCKKMYHNTRYQDKSLYL